MLPLNPWEHYFPMKALYSACMEPVCKKHHITRTELDILLFLVNNPDYDTAADIIEVRHLAKSHVSTSIKALEQAGFLEKYYHSDNRKTVHLSVCNLAASLIDDGCCFDLYFGRKLDCKSCTQYYNGKFFCSYDLLFRHQIYC